MNLRRLLGRTLIAVLALLLILLAISALINGNLPAESEVADKLGSDEKARLAEFLHLRQQLGSEVWPGWASSDTPVILYNEAYAFLIGYPDPPAGWIKVPQGRQYGAAWEPVPDDEFDEGTYYRQRLPADGTIPEAFTVRVGERWVASMPTMEWMEISLIDQLRSEMPSLIRPFFPYPMVADLFLRGSEGYISLIAHESFHAYQGVLASQELGAAERAVQSAESRYPWHNTTVEQAWQTELDLLSAAVEAPTEAEARSLAKQFLTERARRREAAPMTPQLAAYEGHREWLEGLARYAELEIWHRAAASEKYEPLPSVQSLPDFSDYNTFDRRWSQELDQMGRMADDTGDGRFYYSGMAQAFLLDQLLPGWKTRAVQERLFLETLLAEAVGSNEQISGDTMLGQ